MRENIFEYRNWLEEEIAKFLTVKEGYSFDDMFLDDRIEVLQGDGASGERIRLALDDDLEIVIVTVSSLVAAFSEDLEIPLRWPVRPEEPVPGIEAVKTAQVDGTHFSSPWYSA